MERIETMADTIALWNEQMKIDAIRRYSIQQGWSVIDLFNDGDLLELLSEFKMDYVGVLKRIQGMQVVEGATQYRGI
jgi:hypothetical protein